MRYCIFGGSFDPPHGGHRHLARSAASAFRLDRVIWVPSPRPPHKSEPSTPYLHRLAMVRLAVDGMPGQAVSDVEARLPQPSYSLNTIRALKAESGPGHDWFFLMGSDNWAAFTSWHQWQTVLQETSLIIYPRQGHPLGDLPPGVLRLDLPEFHLESTWMRKTAQETGDLEAARVPKEIREYIKAHGLYGMAT